MPRSSIVSLFSTAGLVLFRGFNVTRDVMAAFCRAYSSRFVVDVGRSFDSTPDPIQLVTPGHLGVDLHCEHANGPFRPDLVWFWCQQPAADGGATTFCDGVLFWQGLSESTRDLFTHHRITFGFTYPAWSWRRFLGPQATLVDLRRLADSFPDVRYQINPDQSVSTEFTCAATVPAGATGDLAFANSIRGPYEGTRVTLEDGSPIPEAIIRELAAVGECMAQPINWQAGDLVMLDNSRFLHGRRAFRDARRRIHAALSWRNF